MVYFIYILIILVITVISSLVVPNERRILFTTLSFGSMTVLILLQKKIGYDYDSYTKIFNTIAATPWNAVFDLKLSVEPGFLLVNKLFSMVSLDGELFFRTFLCMIILIFAISSHKYYHNQALCFIIFIAFTFSWLTALRQIMAAGIVFLGFTYVQRRKLIRYILVVLLAMSFHITALLGLLIYPLFSNHVTRNSSAYRGLAGVCIMLLLAFKEQWVSLCRAIVRLIDWRYVRYFSTIDFALNMIVILIGFIIIMCLFMNQNDNRDKRAINFMFVCLAIQACSAITPMAGRFMIYFYPFFPICLERIFAWDKVIDRNGMGVPRKCIMHADHGEKQIMKVFFVAFLIFYWWYTFIQEVTYIM